MFIDSSLFLFILVAELASLRNLVVLDLSYNHLESFQAVQGTTLA